MKITNILVILYYQGETKPKDLWCLFFLIAIYINIVIIMRFVYIITLWWNVINWWSTIDFNTQNVYILVSMLIPSIVLSKN